MAAVGSDFIIIEQQYFVASPESIQVGPAMIPLEEVDYFAFDYFKLNKRLVKRFYISTSKRRFFISEQCYNELLDGKFKTVKLGAKSTRRKAKEPKNA